MHTVRQNDIFILGKYINKLVIAIYVSATSVDHPGWPAAKSSVMFAQWLILSCLVTTKGVVFVLALHNQ